MMGTEKIKEVIVGEDKIYMRKSFDGWRIVYPIKNPDGSWNMTNLILGGSIWKFLKFLMIFLFLIGAIYVYHLDTQTCTETLRHINDTCAMMKINTQNPYITPIGNISYVPPKT